MVHEKILTDLEKQGLPRVYADYISDYIAPVASEINRRRKHQNGALLVGVHGAQGTGKSTLAHFLSVLLESNYGLKSVCLSLDDFYLTRAERRVLAQSVHPLLQTRGVPGTHDIALLQSTLHQLMNAADGSITSIPRFDKAHDDRKPAEGWDTVHGAIDIIILEGWCVAAPPVLEQDLVLPINTLERVEDPDGDWRRWVNCQLAGDYQDLFASIDYLLMLQAPSFECVEQWRGLQEQKLIAGLSARGETATQTMDKSGIQRFIQHYERITRHCLNVVPSASDCVLQLDHEHRMIGCSGLDSPVLVSEPHADKKMNLMVVTDLDGTLLDHHSYSYQAAIPAIERLTRLAIPLVINTSKTYCEVSALMQEMNLCGPCIIENGSAVVFPTESPVPKSECSKNHTALKQKVGAGSTTKVFGMARSCILEVLQKLKDEYHFRFSGFSDWSVEDLMRHTGLSHTSAVNALQRQYSEPIIWQDSDEKYQTFLQMLDAQGLMTLKGGRFIHVQGCCDKGATMRWLKQEIEKRDPDVPELRLVALGDSQNDVAMLSLADVAVVVRSPTHEPPELPDACGTVIVTQLSGPEGWNETINALLDRETG